MTWHAIAILVGAIGAVLAWGLLSRLLDRGPSAWRLLAERYPPEPRQPDERPVEAWIGVHAGEGPPPRRAGCLWILMPWTWGRGFARFDAAVGDEHLHLDGPGGRSASVPWAEIEFGPASATHMGEFRVLSTEIASLTVPSTLVEREADVRRTMEADEPGGPPGPTWG